MLNRERVRRFRHKQKSTSNPDEVPEAYHTPQALGKAVSKFKKALPKSARKKRTVVSKLASPLKRSYKNSKQGNRCIPDEVINLVRDFYRLNDVSHQSPGRKEFVIIRKESKKVQVQKRFLTWSLRETYGMFVRNIQL